MATNKRRPTAVPPPEHQVGDVVLYRGLEFRIAKVIWDNEAGKWAYVLGDPHNSAALDRELCAAYGDRGLN
jgi:hypothetical protein